MVMASIFLLGQCVGKQKSQDLWVHGCRETRGRCGWVQDRNPRGKYLPTAHFSSTSTSHRRHCLPHHAPLRPGLRRMQAQKSPVRRRQSLRQLPHRRPRLRVPDPAEETRPETSSNAWSRLGPSSDITRGCSYNPGRKLVYSKSFFSRPAESPHADGFCSLALTSDAT
jgi:hypothetical protein